jgi:hypothetical protein
MILKDHNNNIVNLGDIVKAENKETKETFYYFYTKDFLYRYDKQGNFSENSLMNIKVDDSVTLLDDETWIWIRLGSKDEVYKTIFKR